jgi:glycosyltransferase involved in cell wall biosynthesis
MIPSDPHKTEMNILVVFDGRRGATATQKISFGQPFDSAPADFPVRIIFQGDLPTSAEIQSAFMKHGADVLVLSRYTSQLGAEWIWAARNAGIPVVFHIDDDLLAVPASLGAAKYTAYNSPERLGALRQNIEGSDLLYVSTGELARRFNEHGIRTPILAGDVYCSVSPDEIGALVGPATGPVIGYMGTSGHSEDLAAVLPAIAKVMDAVPDLQFEVFGTIEMPAELARFRPRLRHLPPVADYADFIPYLRSLGWWIGLAPLNDNPFNRCKADTKWVEYSLAGMGVVASDVPVYHSACAGGAGALATTTEEWRDSLLELLYRPDLRMRMIAKAQEKLRERYTHSILREQVMNVIKAASARASYGPEARPRPQPAFDDGSPQPVR